MLKDKIIALRCQGKSYSEIAKSLDIAKSTVSYWLHDIPLPPYAKRRLGQKILAARKKGLFKFNEQRAREVANENKTIRLEAIREIDTLSKKNLFLIGIALYWGEGAHSEHRKNFELRFVNTDPTMVAIYMRFVREILRIPEDKIRPYIQIHPHIDAREAVSFWSKITAIGYQRFRTFNQVSQASKRIRPKRLLPYGTISIRISGRRLFFRMKGWIEGIANHAAIF